MLVKTMNRLMPKKAPPAPAPVGPTELEVLIQIRDELKKA
jgi:large-conductance mechanosensitive channel